VHRLLIAVVLFACNAPGPPREYGVEIFAQDTVTARLTVSVTGTLQVNVRGENFSVLPDRSFSVGTPASLVIRGGVGTATVTSVDSTQKLAVVPAGTPPDSTDARTVSGTKLYISRMGYEGARLSVARP